MTELLYVEYSSQLWHQDKIPDGQYFELQNWQTISGAQLNRYRSKQWSKWNGITEKPRYNGPLMLSKCELVRNVSQARFSSIDEAYFLHTEIEKFKEYEPIHESLKQFPRVTEKATRD